MTTPCNFLVLTKRWNKKQKKKEKRLSQPIVGVLIEAATGRVDYECHLSITEYRQFVGLFEEAAAPLAKCHLSVSIVFNPFYFNLSPAHFLRPCNRTLCLKNQKNQLKKLASLKVGGRRLCMMQ